MLREALDAAQTGGLASPIDDSETTSLAQESESTSRGYGSTSLAPKHLDDGEDSEGYDDEEEDSYLSETDDWHTESPRLARDPWLKRSWRAIKGCFVIILNVDNLWDEEAGLGAVTRRNHLVVFFWFFVLAVAYAGERSTFYFIVDRTGPFRLFSAEMITSIHALMLGIGMLISAISRRSFRFEVLGIPYVDVALMALLDACALILALITGYHVPPPLTVILVQLTIPLTVFFTQLVHRDGRFRSVFCPATLETEEEEGRETDTESPEEIPEYEPFIGRPLPGWGGLSWEHLWGSSLIAAAVFLGLVPAFISFMNPQIFAYADLVPLRTAYNSVVFALACVPAAASQLYKEHVFLQHKQPVNANHLNVILSILQFTFIMIVSPLVYTLQGMAAPGNWTSLYPSIQFSANFLDGLRCFFGVLESSQAKHGYAEPASCEHSLVFVILHVLSIIMVGVSVDKIVHAGATKVMYRGISAGIILAVISMLIYGFYDPDFNYGLPVDILNCVCTVLIIIGSEIYHRVLVQDSTFVTVYPEVLDLYDEA